MKSISGLLLLAVIAVPATVFQIGELSAYQLQTEILKASADEAAYMEAGDEKKEGGKSFAFGSDQNAPQEKKISASAHADEIMLEKLAARSASNQNLTLSPLQKINLMKASDWMEIKGIGEVTAQHILRLRDELGGFVSLESLLEVKGIGPAKYDAILAWLNIQ